MVNIESIEQKILQLDPGTFQNLCNSYLTKKGYQNIVSLGGQAGTRKTTLGTPDAYFSLANGNYIFVEYTTQVNSLVKKIESDITKCLDVSKTMISHDKISEIIYCHTSSNINPSEDKRLKAICEDVGVKLTIKGINTLAQDIYFYYPILARDFLGLSITTNQILDMDDFIKDYSSSKLAAPIDTKFLFREEEIAAIEKALEKCNVVILSGASGSGKTRLALHYAKEYQKDSGSRLYCINSNDLPIYDDLKLHIDTPGEYIIVIDDANHLSGLKHVIRYTTMHSRGYNVKVIITVRDYAINSVIREIRETSLYEIVKVSLLKDDQIEELLIKNLGIENSIYLERILNIADGNARIAMIAGSIAINSNNLRCIDDVSQLYDDYYGKLLCDEKTLLEKDVLITAGIVAFLGSIHLDNIDFINLILKDKGISRSKFLENIKELNRKEVVDIYNDKAVRFSEQCLANYILKHVFYDRRLLTLSSTVNAFFQENKEKTIFAINTLLNVFRSEDLISFVINEMKELWSTLRAEKSNYFFEFVKSFFRINPIETLIILKNKIEQVETVDKNVSNLDISKHKTYQHVDDELIELLGGYAEMEDLYTALDLFFEYYRKRPDLFVDFYHGSNIYFGIKKDSYMNEYNTQICFLKKIREYSDDWRDENVTKLFLEVSKELLKLNFSPSERGRENTIVLYKIPLTLSTSLKEYRELIWKYIIEIKENVRYQEKIKEVISGYEFRIEEVSKPVVLFDLGYVKEILKSMYSFDSLECSILVNKFVILLKNEELDKDEFLCMFLNSEFFKVYKLLKGPSLSECDNYEQCKEIKKESIEAFCLDANIASIKKLIDVCYECMYSKGCNQWEIGEGLQIAINAIYRDKELYIKTIIYYLDKDTPLNICPFNIVRNLFSLIADDEVYELIDRKSFTQKNEWMYAYYNELPSGAVSKKHLHGLYNFLKAHSGEEIMSFRLRDINFLDKFFSLDKNIFIKACEIILSQKKQLGYIVEQYFELFFNNFRDKPEEVITRFADNIDLLVEIYFTTLSNNKYFDYNGRLIREIYLANSEILKKYINFLTDSANININDFSEQIICFFELDDFNYIYNGMVELFMHRCKIPSMHVPSFIENILFNNKNKKMIEDKQDKWVNQYIKFHANDEIKMKYLFQAISKLNDDRKKEYIKLFLSYNQDFDSFAKIPLFPASYSWSGSLVPMLEGRIKYLELISSLFTGLKWIEHKGYVEKLINNLRKQIEKEQIKEVLSGEV